MDNETKKFFGSLLFLTITFGGIIVGIALDKYYDHAETMAAIQAGLVQDKDGNWVNGDR